MHYRRPLLTLATSAILLLGTACGSGESDDNTDKGAGGGASATASPTSPAPVDPPRGFVSEGTRVGSYSYSAWDVPAYDIFGDVIVTAHVNENDQTIVQVSDLDGQPRAQFVSDFGDVSAPPRGVMTPDGGLVLLAGQRVIEGTGTQKDRRTLVITAHDASTGEKKWSTTLKETPDKPLPPAGEMLFADADAETVLLTSRDPLQNETETTFALNTDDGSLRWREDAFAAVGLSQDTVVGFSYADDELRTVGLSVKDKHQVWTGPEVEYYSDPKGKILGKGLAVLKGDDPEALAGSVTYLVDAATGKPRATLHEAAHCDFDTKKTIVCGAGSFLVGFDADSMKQLWKLSAENEQRDVPGLIATRPGVVYVSSEDNGLLTLTARTGKDLDTALPDLDLYDVVKGYGIAIDEGGMADSTSTVYTHRGTD